MCPEVIAKQECDICEGLQKKEDWETTNTQRINQDFIILPDQGPWRKCLYYLGLPKQRSGEESACNAGDLGSIPESGISLGGGNGYPPPVYVPGKFHGQRSLMGNSSWGCNEQLRISTRRIQASSSFSHPLTSIFYPSLGFAKAKKKERRQRSKAVKLTSLEFLKLCVNLLHPGW